MSIHQEIMDDWERDHPVTAGPQWAKLSDLKAGDTIELHGFDCASGVVTLKANVFDQLYFDCGDGRHYIEGQLDNAGYLIGITIRPAATIIPITQERTTMDINTDDANSVSRFFQSIADKVVLASTLPAEVAELRASVERLKADVENYHERMIRADEEITNLRRERQALQDENSLLRSDLSESKTQHGISESRWGQACQERDRWHNEAIAVSSTLEDTKRERDDAQMKIMELERDLRDALADKNVAQRQCDEVINKLNSIRSALA